MNCVILKGNLTRDPERTVTPKGTVICDVDIAVNKWVMKGEQREEVVSFFRCVAFGKIAEIICEHFRKGKPILLRGELSQEKWEDKQTGQKRSATRIIINEFEFCGGDRISTEPKQPTSQTQLQPQSASDIDAGDDIPF